MPARKRFAEDELKEVLDAFHTDEPLMAVGKRLGYDHNRTIKRLWVEHFGYEAYKARVSRLYGAPKLGQGNPMWGKKGEAHPRWVGERTISPLGYCQVKPPAWYTGPASKGRVAEHTIVACQMLGLTEIPAHLVVHHKNEDKQDNRPENLEVLDRGTHMVTHRWLRHRRKVQRLSRKGVGPKRGRSAQPRSIAGDDIV